MQGRSTTSGSIPQECESYGAALYYTAYKAFQLFSKAIVSLRVDFCLCFTQDDYRLSRPAQAPLLVGYVMISG